MDYRKPGTVEVVYPIDQGTPDHTHPYVTGAVRPGPQIAVCAYGDGKWMADVQYAKVRKDGSTSAVVGEMHYTSGGTAMYGEIPQYVIDAAERAITVWRFAFPEGSPS